MDTTVDQSPATVNLVVYHGDSWQQTFRCLTAGAPMDLAAFTLTAGATGTTGDAVPLVVAIVDVADGTFQLSLPAGGLPPDLYDYDVQADGPSGVVTWIRGYLRVEQDVTP